MDINRNKQMDINRNNYEEFFLLRLDGELSPSENSEVEEFLSRHADLQKEFAALKQTVIPISDASFEPKELLFRKEEKRRVIPFYRFRIAAAVALVLAGSWFVLLVVNSRPSDKRLAEGKETATGQVKQVAESKAANANTNLPSGQTFTKTDIAKTTKKDSPLPVAKIKRQVSGNDRQASVNDLQDERNKKQETAMQGTETGNNQGEQGILQKNSVASVQPAGHLNITREQPADHLNTTREPAVSAEVKPSALTMAAAGAGIAANAVPPKTENTAETNNQTDNAISVIALNEKNKSITGFFKKLTRRAAPDPNERKLRVSVFQLSY